MVGVVIFKNFETGSYADVRITMYEGSSFSDIERQEAFSSCTVNLDKKIFKYDYISDDTAPVIGMDAALELAAKARAYLYEHPYVTLAEFCVSGTECKFRPSSVKGGVYAPADFQSVFKHGSFFMLCTDCKAHTFTWVSALCEGINFALQMIFNTSAQIFTSAAGGVYIDLMGYMYSRKVRRYLDLPENIINVIAGSGMPGHRISLKPIHTDEITPEGGLSAGPRARIIYLYRSYKCRVHNYIADMFRKPLSPEQVMELIISLPADEEIKHMTDEFAGDLSEYTGRYHDYGYVTAKSHADMLTVREALSLPNDISLMKTVSQIAAARSSNMKMYKNLPCAPYYGSDGTAYWD